MRRPKATGSVLQALEPARLKLEELEGRALLGEALPVVELAAALGDCLREVARQAMELVLDQAARAEPRSRPCACGRQADSKGFEDRSFVGRFGRVLVSRRRFTCECGSTSFLLDTTWALPAGDYADDVREALDRLSCRMTFREATAELDHLWGVAPDASTAKRWISQDGARAEAAVKADASTHWTRYEAEVHAVACGERPAAQRTDGFGVIEVDGVQALTWKPGQEPRRRTGGQDAAPASESVAATPTSENAERATRHQAPSTLSEIAGSPMGPTGRSPRVHGREVCVGLVYLGEHACEESPGRGVLLDKRYVATLDDREGFWPKLHAAATTQGVLSRKEVVRLSDGGKYFIDQTAELFSDQPLVGILDCQHAKQHVWEAGHKLATAKPEVDAWVQPRTKAVMDGRVDEVIAGLEDECERRRGRPRAAIEELSGYLDRHKHLMDYPRYEAAGYPIASSAVESANKRLVGRRCKQGGMIWSESGLEAMVATRVAFMNPGAWQSLWPHVKAPDL
jgi:hypothetical protein